jgi:hypothetical protein
MFWPIHIYIVLSVVIAGSAAFNERWAAALYAIATSSLFLIAGVRLKQILFYQDWGKGAGRTRDIAIAGIIASIAAVLLAKWLSTGFSAQLFGYSLSGGLWGWIGFATCFLFADKKLGQ